tara:strand:+ start:645 stop:1532 length:888 start_codon:yes stop_codon:yes gene_type:complete
MGKVYVLAKAETPPMMVQGAGGGGNASGLLMNIQGNIAPKDAARSVMEERYGKQNIPVRQSPSPKYTPSQLVGIGDKTTNMASKFGKYGGIAGALAGGINSFYNASSSGQPGALGAAAMGGWTGQQMTQPYATKIGAQVGVRAGEKAVDRDMSTSQGGFDEAQRMNQGLDGFKGSQSMKPMNFESNPIPSMPYQEFQNEIGIKPQMTFPPSQSPPLGPPGPNTNNPITSNLQPPQPVAVTGADTKDGSLGKYGKVGVSGGNTQVDNLDPTKLVQAQTDGVDENGNIITGTAKQQG